MTRPPFVRQRVDYRRLAAHLAVAVLATAAIAGVGSCADSAAAAGGYSDATPRLIAAGNAFERIAAPRAARSWSLDYPHIRGGPTTEHAACAGELLNNAGRVVSRWTVAYSTRPGTCRFRVTSRTADGGAAQAPAHPGVCVKVIAKREAS